MTAVNPYALLGVSSSADVDEIKTAYRRIARRLHPDHNHRNPGAAAQFQEITSAYELLLDDNRRRAYDRSAARLSDDQMHLSMIVTPSKLAIIPLPEPQVIYLLAEILPDPGAPERIKKHETRVNLTLVLDRSKSMDGSRLERVKVAAHQIIDQLRPADYLSVISFSDRAELSIAATAVVDKPALKARISMMAASGGTEIYQGLHAGVEQNQKFLAPGMVNHVVLLTDGNTFGDEEECIKLAHYAARHGITISAMGLGDEWNDKFLDEIASITGGTCNYVASPSQVVRFLNDHVRNLANVFAERLLVSAAPDPDIRLESAFKLSPNPQPLPIDEAFVPLGSLQVNRPMSVLFQLEVPAQQKLGFRSLARIVTVGDVLEDPIHGSQAVSDVSIEVTANPLPEEPPTVLMEALGKLTLYRMQERAQELLEQGDVKEATRRLERLATRLLAMGEVQLAQQAHDEARRVHQGKQISDEGRKTLKFHTRYLLVGADLEEDLE